MTNVLCTLAPSVADILESFDTHHPLVLPDGDYQLQLGRAVTDCGLREQLDKLNEFISIVSQRSRIATAPEEYQVRPFMTSHNTWNSCSDKINIWSGIMSNGIFS